MYENRNNLVTKSLLHQHKAVFLTHIVKNNDLKAPNPLYYLILFILFHVNLMYLYVTHMSFVCHAYVLVCHPYVTCMYSYIIRMSLVYTRMSSVCHPSVLVCHSYVTRMHSYVIRMSLVCGFTMNSDVLPLLKLLLMVVTIRTFYN